MICVNLSLNYLLNYFVICVNLCLNYLQVAEDTAGTADTVAVATAAMAEEATDEVATAVTEATANKRT